MTPIETDSLPQGESMNDYPPRRPPRTASVAVITLPPWRRAYARKSASESTFSGGRGRLRQVIETLLLKLGAV
jgi:hypothetical protein